MGVDEFGKWANKQIDDHPEVNIMITTDQEGYRKLAPEKGGFKPDRSYSGKALTDTGA